MPNIFFIEEGSVKIYPQTLLISPFKEIWERDKTKDKVVAYSEFAYIEFMGSQAISNPYRQEPVEIKEGKIRAAVIKEEDWVPDDLIKKGIEMVQYFQKEGSTKYRLLLVAVKAAKKVEDFLDKVDLMATNEKTGSLLYKAADIFKYSNDLSKFMELIDELEKKVEEDCFKKSKIGGGKKISYFAMPESIDDYD